jgi:predicted transcriptional regulator
VEAIPLNHLNALQSLKKILKTRGISYRMLGKELKVSEATIKRSLSTGQLTFERFAQICRIADIDWSDLEKDDDDKLARTLTEEQELLFSTDTSALRVFYLLLQGFDLESISSKLKFSETKIEKILCSLEKVKILNLYPGNRVKLKVSPHVQWLAKGPLIEKFCSKLLVDFFKADFESSAELLRLHSLQISSYKAQLVSNKIQKFIDEINDMSCTEDASERLPHGVLVAFRSWDSDFWAAAIEG